MGQNEAHDGLPKSSSTGKGTDTAPGRGSYRDGGSSGSSSGSVRGSGGPETGVEYCVLATKGHVRQLAKKPNAVKPDAGFAMDWQPVEGSQEPLANILKKMPW